MKNLFGTVACAWHRQVRRADARRSQAHATEKQTEKCQKNQTESAAARSSAARFCCARSAARVGEEGDRMHAAGALAGVQPQDGGLVGEVPVRVGGVGQPVPRLDGDVRRARLGPQQQVGVIGKFHLHRRPALVFQRRRARAQPGEQQRVVCKHLRAQGQRLHVVRVGDAPARQLAARVLFGQNEVFPLRKAHRPVGKVAVRGVRLVRAEVAVQRRLARVLRLRLDAQRPPLQRVVLAQQEGEGVLGERLRVLAQGKDGFPRGDLLGGKGHALGKPVVAHLVALAAVGVGKVAQPPAHREQQRAVLGPEGGVRLPDILTVAVADADDLRAPLGDLDAQSVAL